MHVFAECFVFFFASLCVSVFWPCLFLVSLFVMYSSFFACVVAFCCVSFALMLHCLLLLLHFYCFFCGYVAVLLFVYLNVLSICFLCFSFAIDFTSLLLLFCFSLAFCFSFVLVLLLWSVLLLLFSLLASVFLFSCLSFSCCFCHLSP